MTTGNITVMPKQSNMTNDIKSLSKDFTVANNNFQTFLDAGYGKNDISAQTKKDTKSTNDVNESYVGTKNSVAEKVLKQNDKRKTEEIDVAGIYNAIYDAVKKELNLSDEEMSSKMAELSLTAADLLEPNNLVQLIASVNETDVTEILTNSDLTMTLSDMTEAIDTIVTQSALDNNMSKEDMTALLKEAQNTGEALFDDTVTTEITSENAFETEFVTVDNKEAKVTVDAQSTTKEVENVVYTEKTVTTETSKDESPADETSDNHTMDKGNESLSESILNALTQSVDSAISETTSFADRYSVNGTDIINQMIEAIRVNVNADTSSMEILLTPESLGKINLNVTSKDGIITATITAQNEAVRNVIENQVVQLKESLNNQGLKVNEVEVAIASEGFDMNDQNGGHMAGDGHSDRRRVFNAQAGWFEDDRNDEDFEQKIMEMNGNSVSYLA